MYLCAEVPILLTRKFQQADRKIKQNFTIKRVYWWMKRLFFCFIFFCRKAKCLICYLRIRSSSLFISVPPTWLTRQKLEKVHFVKCFKIGLMIPLSKRAENCSSLPFQRVKSIGVATSVCMKH